jgi:hypothetical protein
MVETGLAGEFTRYEDTLEGLVGKLTRPIVLKLGVDDAIVGAGELDGGGLAEAFVVDSVMGSPSSASTSRAFMKSDGSLNFT